MSLITSVLDIKTAGCPGPNLATDEHQFFSFSFLCSCIFNQVGPAALADASTEKEKLVVAVSSSIVHRSRCFAVDNGQQLSHS